MRCLYCTGLERNIQTLGENRKLGEHEAVQCSTGHGELQTAKMEGSPLCHGTLYALPSKVLKNLASRDKVEPTL